MWEVTGLHPLESKLPQEKLFHMHSISQTDPIRKTCQDCRGCCGALVDWQREGSCGNGGGGEARKATDKSSASLAHTVRHCLTHPGSWKCPPSHSKMKSCNLRQNFRKLLFNFLMPPAWKDEPHLLRDATCHQGTVLSHFQGLLCCNGPAGASQLRSIL